MGIAVLILYGIALLFIFFYSLIQINLVYNYVRRRKRRKAMAQWSEMHDADLPMVTVQLPVYNELYVVQRLIDSVAEFDYPVDKLEIQVLDDSDDETVDVIAEKVAEWKAKGRDIVHFRRPVRQGFKAGALAEGLVESKGEFVAVFDADFLPKKEFLRMTVPYFQDEKVGVVQTKWEHINRSYSWLTRLQAFGLDAHFSIEQTGRNVSGHFINFNGTAGIWRKSCINDAGGWQSDTLTEDLDLSYRAQLRGWQFHYLEEFGSPAELPAAMNALKTQQFRWTKGAAECTRKNLMKVLRAGHLNWSTKLHAIFHLMNSAVFLSILMITLLSVPVIVLKNQHTEYESLFNYAGFFLISLVFLAFFYFTSIRNQEDDRSFFGALGAFLVEFPLFLSVSMGLSLHNAIAVIEGYIGRKTPFIRTPKFNITDRDDKWQNNKYLVSSVSMLTIFEALFTLYAALGIFFAFKYNDFGLLPYHVMLLFGFGYVTISSVVHSRSSLIAK